MIIYDRYDRVGRVCAFVAATTLVGAPVLAAPISEADAIARALASPELIALGEANRAEVDARVAGIRRFDNPELSISREGVSGGGGASETEYEAGIVQPFDLSGQRSRLRDAARAEVRAVDADTARRRQERVAEVRRSYAGCAAAREKVLIADAFVARLREAERIVTARTRGGDTAGYDLRRLRVEARSAEARARLVAGDLAAECTALSRLTGKPDARPLSSLSAIAQRPVSPTIGVTRADLVARQERLAAASLGVRAAERARIPEFAVGLGYKRISSAGESASGPIVSVGARLPLFNRGGAVISEARARQRAREAELGLARREVEANVAVAQGRVNAALLALRSAVQALDHARRLGPIAEAAYQGGEGGVTELVDAYRAAQEAEIEVIDLLERTARARVDAELAQGNVS